MKLFRFFIVLFFFANPVFAQDLRIGLGSEPTAMDPHYHNLSPNNSMLSHIFDSLVGQDERQRLTPDLAESWKAIDATTWEFKLRRNVRFHDGTPFTADDVIFSFERAPNVEGSPSSFGIYARGKTFVKVDDHTIHIKTAAPYPLMPNDVSQVFIISRKDDEGNTYQTRRLADGSSHEVLKNFPAAQELRSRLGRFGTAVEFSEYEYYWVATCRIMAATISGGVK